MTSGTSARTASICGHLRMCEPDVSIPAKRDSVLRCTCGAAVQRRGAESRTGGLVVQQAPGRPPTAIWAQFTVRTSKAYTATRAVTAHSDDSRGLSFEAAGIARVQVDT